MFSNIRVNVRQHSTITMLGAIIVLGAGIRIWLLTRGVPTLDSDEATIALMARHIQQGEWPVFFWGQTYMGSLEAFCIAPFFALFGSSPFLLHLVPTFIGLLGIFVIAQLGIDIASPMVGLLSALTLAIGPPFFTVLGMRAFGGYVETLLFGSLILLLVLHGCEKRRDALILGLLVGLALWTNMLIIPYLISAGLILWLRGIKDTVGRLWKPMIGGTLLGAAPAIFYNIVNHAATITTILGYTLASHDSSNTGRSLLQNAVDLVTVSIPIVVGASGGVHSAGMTSPEQHASFNQRPWEYIIAICIAIIVAVLFISAARRLWNERQHIRGRTLDAMQLQGRAALLLVAILYIGGLAISRQDIFAMPRYLFPAYAAVIVVIAEIIDCWHALARRWQFVESIKYVTLAVLTCMLLTWNLTGIAALTPVQTAPRDHGKWITSDDTQLVQILRDQGIKTVISNDYWESMRLIFESNEQVIVIMITPEGHPGYTRYQPYLTSGLRDPRPAYLELMGTPEVTIHATTLGPNYKQYEIGPYMLFLPK
jgi:4-amino-4-deoxy-L-arabinose transferase-like glycosyltransferase